MTAREKFDDRVIEQAKAFDVATIARQHGVQLKGRRHLAGPCPHCGGTDRFWIDAAKQIFNCHLCGPDKPQFSTASISRPPSRSLPGRIRRRDVNCRTKN